MAIRSKRMSYQIVAVVVGLSPLLGACSSPAPAPTEVVETPAPVPTEVPELLEPISQEDLVGTTWQWVGGQDATSSPYQVADPHNYTLFFNEDGTLFIKADCNTSRSTYELSGDQLSITLGPPPWQRASQIRCPTSFWPSSSKPPRLGVGLATW